MHLWSSPRRLGMSAGADAHAFPCAPPVQPPRGRAPLLRAAIAGLLLATLPAHAQSPPGEAAPDPVLASQAQVPGALAPPAVTPTLSRPPSAPPPDLRRVGAWTAWRTQRHLASLPVEARIFYRRGLTTQQGGQIEEALADVRGAAELDPTFAAPHLTLAAWMLTRDPSQALQQYAKVVELLRQDFNLQFELAANAILVGFEALFAALLLASVLVVWLRRDELTHAWREQLARYATPGGAKRWATALAILPFCTGFGLTLPALAMLGYLWPSLRVRERILFVALLVSAAGMPLVLNTIERLSLPLQEDVAPLYCLPRLENAAYDPEREAGLARIAAAHPDDALVQFGLGWSARRGGHLLAAEAAYRRALAAWPEDDRIWNNLGNVLAVEGRTDEALTCYAKAVRANPANAAAYFNQGQLHTQRFDYQAATQALSRASALNFELVRTAQAQATMDGLLPLIDQWLSPKVFWRALSRASVPPSGRGALPVSLRAFVETTGWPFSLMACLLAAAGLAAGIWQADRLPLRNCSNCGRVVCRRCAERRRELALCPACAEVEGLAEATDFAHALLLRQRGRQQGRRHLGVTALAALIPGYGLLAHRRVLTPLALFATTWLLARAWIGAAPPIAVEPRLALPGQETPPIVLAAAVVLVYAVSLLGYFHVRRRDRLRQAGPETSMSTRVTQSTRRTSAAA
jgi:tetratricopeptide (TPR) repeat protein